MKLVLLLIASGLSWGAFAEDATPSTSAETKLKIEDVKEKNKVDGDIDTEITNAKLRAESGSKSRWSGSMTATYQGGSLEKPLSKFRPNTSQEATPPQVKLIGDLAIRYRMNKNNSFTFGTGASLSQPFHGAKYGDVSNPYVGYGYVTKFGAIQSVTGVNVGITTDADERSQGQLFSESLSQTMMYDFNGSRLSVGLSFGIEHYHFKNNKYDRGAIKYRNGTAEQDLAGTSQRNWTVAAYPLMEYAINDRVQLRTVFRPWIYDHYLLRKTGPTTAANQDGLTFDKRRWTQSFGVGIAVIRDVYLYPNFQWDVEQWRENDYNFFARKVRANSTVGLNATVNVF